MTSNRQPGSPEAADTNATEEDVLVQLVREVDGLRRLEHLVPAGLLWDRPPGLPSGGELLWLLHLVDTHVFLPAVEDLTHENEAAMATPDYGELLERYPCTVKDLEELCVRISTSRQDLVDRLRVARASSDAHKGLERLIERIVKHDRRILVAFAERLYESGLGT